MREKDREVPHAGGTECMSSSQVKQTLSKLENDGDGRRNAMSSLKQFVENMDDASVPRFVSQISETKEKDNSRVYAISLYEDIARVHGKLIIPQLHRVMSTVIRSLSSSGSSPQLQQACAKVLSAIAKYAVDENENLVPVVLRDLCDPLLEVLAGKLEPLAAGAAVCLQSLVECENWKFASDETVADVCLITTVALAEKGTRTVAHMQLARTLATTNSGSFCKYGLSILRSGVEALKLPVTATAVLGSWQQRTSAARLLGAVLPTVDRATLADEFGPTVQALESSKHDRMSNVRWAVKDALKTARVVFTEENSRRSSYGENPLSWATVTSPDTSLSISSSPRRSGMGSASGLPSLADSPTSPRNKNARFHRESSPISSTIPVSPSAPPESPSPRAHRAPRPFSSGKGGLQQQQQERSPLRATRLHSQVGLEHRGAVGCLAKDCDSPRKENLPASAQLQQGDSDGKVGHPAAVDSSEIQSVGLRPSTPGGTSIPYPPSAQAHEQSMDSPEIGSVVSPRGSEGKGSVSAEEWGGRGDRDEQGEDLGEEEEAFLASIVASSDEEFNNEAGDPPKSVTEQLEMKTDCKENGSRGGSSFTGSRRQASTGGVLDGSTMKHVFELKGPVVGSNGSALRNVRTRDLADENAFQLCSVSPSRAGGGDWKEPFIEHELYRSPVKIDSPKQDLRAFQDDSFSPQKVKAVIAAEDFLPFATPRRLVRSLQDSFSNSLESKSGRFLEMDVSRQRGEETGGGTTTTDLDLGTPTSSSTGWSVRTNPIASDGSVKTDSDDSDNEQGRAVWKKMTSHSSTSPTPPAAPHTPAQETNNSDLDAGVRQRLNHPAEAVLQDNRAELLDGNSTGDVSPSSPGEESLRNLQEQISTAGLFDDAEIIKRTKQGTGLRALLMEHEDLQSECIDKWSCSETGEGAGCDAPEVEDGSQTQTCATRTVCVTAESCNVVPHKAVKMENLGDNARGFFSWGWSQGRYHALCRWQLCVVVVAIPLAVILLSKRKRPSTIRTYFF